MGSPPTNLFCRENTQANHDSVPPGYSEKDKYPDHPVLSIQLWENKEGRNSHIKQGIIFVTILCEIVTLTLVGNNAIEILIALPVSDEPVYAKCHKFEEGLNDEDAGKHVVTVLQNLS